MEKISLVELDTLTVSGTGSDFRRFRIGRISHVTPHKKEDKGNYIESPLIVSYVYWSKFMVKF